MADWNPTPEQAEIVKAGLSGGFGAGMRIYLRPTVTALVGLLQVLLGVGMALIFADTVSEWTGWPIPAAGFLIGLCGQIVAGRLLKAAEKGDLALLFKRDRE